MTSIDQFDTARAAGLNARQAARWVAYLAMKDTRSEQPIPLDEAVMQVRVAEAMHRARRRLQASIAADADFVAVLASRAVKVFGLGEATV